MSLVAYASSDDEEEAAAAPGPVAARRRGQPVRITAPALRAADSDDDDEEPKVKRFAPPAAVPGATGLSALLPKPRSGVVSAATLSGAKAAPLAGTKVSSRPLVPHALAKARRAAAPTPPPAQAPSPSAIKAASRAAVLQRVARQAVPHGDSDDDDDEDGGEGTAPSAARAGFFSLPARPSSEAAAGGVAVGLPGAGAVPCPVAGDPGQDAPLEFSGSKADAGIAGDPAQFPGDYGGGGGYQGYYEQPYGAETAPAVAEPGTSIVDNDAFRRLQGKRNRGEEINFIEIKGEEQMSGAKEWLTKSLTQEKTMKSFSKKKGDQPSSQQKRKHQITYLMHQAKERELELKNSWADNKLTRRQTQAKYGF